MSKSDIEQALDELRAHVADLRGALEEIRGCVQAAQIEGLPERLTEADIHDVGSLADLVSRRLLYVYPIADATLDRTPAQSLARVTADALREAAEVIENTPDYEWVGTHREGWDHAAVHLRHLAAEKEAANGR